MAADRFGAHVEAIDELAALDGVESVEVESWWAIALYPEWTPLAWSRRSPRARSPRRERRRRRSSSTAHLPGADDPNAVTINEEAAEESASKSAAR